MVSDKRDFLSELENLDWDFGDAGEDTLAGAHWYPARFIPQVPGVLLGHLTREGGMVLDPFCGSGTTLVEARRIGRNAIGIDTNPIATLIANAKVSAIDPDELRAYSADLRGRVERALTEDRLAPESQSSSLRVPRREENEKWFQSETLRELLTLWESLRDTLPPARNVAEAAFSAILRSASSQPRHWGWICDNVRPKSLHYRPAAELFFSKMHEFEVGFRDLARSMHRQNSLASRQVAYTGRCNVLLREFDDATFDAVITSPPYFGVTDYMRSQRLSFLWFDLPALDEVKHEESGARFKRHRKDGIAEFLAEMEVSFREIARVLRPGGFCVVVFAESRRRESHAHAFEAILRSVGLDLQRRIARQLPRQRSLTRSILDESILILRRAE